MQGFWLVRNPFRATLVPDLTLGHIARKPAQLSILRHQRYSRLLSQRRSLCSTWNAETTRFSEHVHYTTFRRSRELSCWMSLGYACVYAHGRPRSEGLVGPRADARSNRRNINRSLNTVSLAFDLPSGFRPRLSTSERTFIGSIIAALNHIVLKPDMDRFAPPEVPEPHYIALYGGTGVGKSTFVNDATGGDSMHVGHDLRSCTQQVVASEPFDIDGQNVVLFDTPGFDDTTMSDADTLKRIAEFLESMYRRGVTLKGIVYLHRITDMRMMGASARTFRLLRSLCGAKNLSNVVIVTNMWTDPPTEDEQAREDQLKNEFFKAALDNGAQMMRREHQGKQSAHAVLRALLPRPPKVLEIQRDLVDRGVPLPQTDAGRLVEAELRFKLDKQEQELRDLRDEIKTALTESNMRAQRELERYKERKEREMNLLQEQIASLGVEIEEGRRFWETQFEDMKARRIQAMRLADEQVGRDY